jgi:anti-sigma factor RsiW
MNCPLETRENAAVLIAHAAGELAPDTAIPLERHIAACPACSQFLQRQQAVWDALDVWQPETISADFDRRLYARIRELERQASWWQRLIGPLRPVLVRQAVPIGATAVVLLAATMLLDRSRVPTVRPQEVRAEMLQPEQVEHALDDMETIGQFDRMMRSGNSDSKM